MKGGRALAKLPPPEDHETTRGPTDFAVSIKVRNGRFLNALRKAGYKSVSAFCKKHKLPQQSVNRYATMTLSPLRRSGQTTKQAQAVADILNMQIDELFPPRFLALCLERTARTELPMTEGQIGMLLREPPRTPEDVLALDQVAAQVSDTLVLLPPREERLLRLRFGMGSWSGRTLEQAGNQLDVSPERARQIENTALRKLRAPKRGYRLVEAARVLGIGEFKIAVPVRKVTPAEAGIRQAGRAYRDEPRLRYRPPPDFSQPVRRRQSFPPVSPPPPVPPPEPDYIRLLRIPAATRSDEIKRAIAYHLEEEFVRRGGTRIRPNGEFSATWDAMEALEQQMFKYHWFLRHWRELWDLFPPEPIVVPDGEHYAVGDPRGSL
jgi:RNA polymerase sigma factor (sigma-70 family)